jgi:hypothetical protein
MPMYKIDTYISGDGTITLPSIPALYNKKVQIVIVPVEEKKEEKPSALDFLRRFSGILKDLPNADPNDARYEYLMKKYDINQRYVSDEDLNEAKCN